MRMNRAPGGGDSMAGGTDMKLREMIIGMLLMIAFVSYGSLAAVTLLG
jgi:hypothetical protein